MRHTRLPIILAFAVALETAAVADARAALEARNTTELRAAVDRLRASGGTIVLRPARYSSIVVGPRGARRLTIVARPGASTGSVSLHATTNVRIVGLRLAPGAGRARLFVRGSRGIRLEALTVAGGARGANASVLDSEDVVVARTEFSRCGEGKTPDAGYCLRLLRTRGVRILASRFHDCFGCDFVHGARNVGLTVRRSRFDRALVGRCGHSVENCHHQDLVHLIDGGGILIERNRFGLQEWPGAAQVYLNGNMHGARIVNNLFVGRDPRVPGVSSPRALWVGNRRATTIPSGVAIVNNTILTGRPRVLLRDDKPTAVSVFVSPLYGRLPRAQRPLVANNVLALVRTPERVCPFIRSTGNVVVRGTVCAAGDVVAQPALGAEGRPTSGSVALIGRAVRRYAPPHDYDGRRRDAAPDIGAFEYDGRP